MRLNWNNDFEKGLLKPAIVIALITILNACTSTKIDEHVQRPERAEISSEDAVVVLGRRHNSDYETEPDFINCIGSRLANGDPGFRLISETEFMNSLYPWFEPRTAPMAMNRFASLMEMPSFEQRVRDMKLKYVIWVDGSTERVDSMGSISCAVGPGGAGCLGFGSWQDDATYEASIWDVHQLQQVANVSANAEGTSYMPAFVVPIPLIARVQASACEGLGKQLQTLFVEGAITE